MFAAFANGWEHHAIPRDVLLRALQSERSTVRLRAALSIGVKREPETVPALLRALKQPEEVAPVRREIYRALGRIGDSRATLILIDALKSEQREELRAEAAAALGAIAAPSALLALLGALGDSSFAVRARSVDALGDYSQAESIEALSHLVESGETRLRVRAIRALGVTGSEQAVSVILETLDSASESEQRISVTALGRIGSPRARDALTHLLEKNSDPALRLSIIVALGSIRDGSATPTLINMLDTNDPAAQRFAVIALHRLRSPEAAEPIRTLYFRTSKRQATRSEQEVGKNPAPFLADNSVQRQTLRALLDIDAPGGLPAFLDAAPARFFPQDSAQGLQVNEAVYELRRLAVTGLGYTDADEAAEFLTASMLDDPDPRLRAAALRSLGILSRESVVESALEGLRDSHAEVRWTGATVLGRVGGDKALGPLRTAVSDRHAEVRRQAVLSLAFLGDTTAAETLSTLAASDPSARVKAAAEEALDILGADFE